MNIAQVARRFVRTEWGGTETVILESCKRLLALGHRTEVLASSALADREGETLDGVPVRRFPYVYPYWGLSAEARLRLDKKGGNLFSFRLARALRKIPDLDLIHLHTQKRLGGIGRHVARRRGIPYVVSLHGGVLDVPDAEARSWTEPTQGAVEWGKLLGWWVGSRRVLDDAAAVLCVGAEEQRRVQAQFPAKRVLHLPNGVAPERFARGDGPGFRRRHGVAADARVLLTVGRLDPQKNQRLLVEILPALLRAEPGVHLVLLGPPTSPAYAEELARTAKAAALEPRVTIIPGLPGDSAELADAYHAADLFVLPSIHEPFGIVVLEAWAAGLPVVASRVGGLASLVTDGETGVLVPPGDGEALTRACREALASPERRRDWAEAGRARVRGSYSWERIVDRLVGIYDEVRRADPQRS